MSLKVDIDRPKGMSREEAEELLYKALSVSRDGNAHQEGFKDPAMQSVADLMNKLHKRTIDALLDEIFSEIDKEKF